MAYRRIGRFVPRDADQQEEAGTAVDEPRPGDLVTDGDEVAADHVAFWLGGGRILHATGRDGVDAVVEEESLPTIGPDAAGLFAWDASSLGVGVTSAGWPPAARPRLCGERRHEQLRPRR
jgi:cell wall-associated NlpC family hydrolase